MLEMYAPMVNSPITELATAIDDTQTTIEVVDGSKLPDAPNLAMIGLGEDTETILYTEKNGNVLSGVTRGFQGVAKAWPQGTRVARFFSAYDHNAFMQNILGLKQAHDAHLAEKVTDVGGVHGLVCEEGNWTPTLYGATTTGSNTYSQQIGRYVRIGNLVNVQFRVLLSLKDPSMSGAARIGGLPFINDQILAANAYISNIALDSGRTGVHLVLPAGANFIQLTQTGAGLPGAFLDSSAIVDNSDIIGSFSYKIMV